MTPPLAGSPEAAAGILRFREFLHRRDGEADLLRHTLSNREAFFRYLDETPVRARTPIDRAAYLRNLARRTPEPGLDQRTLWLLATAKINQAERFGVGMAELFGLARPDDPEPAKVHVLLQETYHTRLLAHVAGMWDLPVYTVPPRILTRAVVKFLISVPEAWGLPLAGSAEMAGCTLFPALRDRGLELFADEPRVCDRIRELYDEILGDEIGHTGFCAAQLGPFGRGVLKALYRGLRLVYCHQVVEVMMVLDRDRLLADFGRFDLSRAAAAMPDKAFTAALI